MPTNFFWSVLFPILVIACFLVAGLVYIYMHPPLWYLLGPRRIRWVLVLKREGRIYQFDKELTEKEALDQAEALISTEKEVHEEWGDPPQKDSPNAVLFCEFRRW
jgi:hypothetical protein